MHGVDASPAMLAKLHENDPTGDITTSVGDFGELAVEERYDLVLTALNTFFMLPTQEQQISCLRGIHDALADGGAAVFETYNPQVYHRLTEATTRVGHLAPDALLLDTVQVNQSLQSVLVVHTVMGAWPAEGAGGQPVRLARRVRRDGPARGTAGDRPLVRLGP
ncbi:hypothetical protein SALBM135S_02291 [Streptomyces alboniger]